MFGIGTKINSFQDLNPLKSYSVGTLSELNLRSLRVIHSLLALPSNALFVDSEGKHFPTNLGRYPYMDH